MEDTIYTVGHSTHPQERFIGLLLKAGVTAISDVRSKPYSRVNPQFNREALKQTLKLNGISYVFLGKELGARSDDSSCYEDGKVRYDRLAKTPVFQSAIDRVLTGSQKHRIALMCAEKEPLDCHRTILVARHLQDLDFAVLHIHADGALERHEAALTRLIKDLKLPDHDMFRSYDDIVSDAYRLQEKRIAYDRSAVPNESAAMKRFTG